MDALFDKIEEVNRDIKRNIVSLIVSEDLFDDLHGNDSDSSKLAQAMENRIKKDISPDLISRGFHYTTAIDFPFKTENYQATRYSDGSFACWYGSKDLETTIYETAYHALKDVSNIIGIDEIIHRERAIYNILCRGILIDLVGKQQAYPALVTDGYDYTQSLGKKIANGGNPGLLAPSARKKEGVNVVVFKQEILSEPRLSSYLIYHIDPIKKIVSVKRSNGKNYCEISLQGASL